MAGIESLTPGIPPLEPAFVFPVCDLAFRPVVDLPDRYSRAVAKILPDEAQTQLYDKLHREVRYHGIPENIRPYCSMGKLFGWPKLVQGEDLGSFRDDDAHGMRLLLQVDDYSNGVESQGWGPGGSLYFLIRDRDMHARRFDRCTFEIQVT